MEPPNFLVLFFFGFLADFLYLAGLHAVMQKKAAKATAYSVSLEAFKLATAWLIISHDSLLGAFAFLIGGALGTYISVKNRS